MGETRRRRPMNRPVVLMLVVMLVLAGLIPLTATAAPYGASYAPNPDPLPSLTTGQTTTVSVTVKNTGTLTWEPAGSNPVHLSYHWYATGAFPAGSVPTTPPPEYGAVVFNGRRTTLPGPVGSQASVTLNAQVQAPTKPGTYVLKWDLVREGVTWFSWQQVLTRDQTVTVRSRATVGEPFKALRATCKIVECDQVRITKVVPFFSMIIPGGPVVIEGRGFGTQPGEVRLVGTIPRGTLGAFQVGYLPLEDLQWGDALVYGKIPNVTAVLDQPAKLVVLTKDGGISNALEVQFRATRDLITLVMDDVKVVKCSDDANDNICNRVRIPPDSGWYIADTGIFGLHYNCWGCVGDDLGIDSYEIRLKNTWEFESVSLGTSESVAKREAEIISGVWDFPRGGTFWAPAIQWRVTPNDLLMYWVYTDIVGPKGIPYK
jgi:hypothetical protein